MRGSPVSPFPGGRLKAMPFTTDTFLEGALVVRQPRNGYRFSLDAPILAWHARPRPGETVLDLGAGCGIVSLVLARRHEAIRIYGVEIQEELASLAKENVSANGFGERVTIIHGDMRDLRPGWLPRPVDVVVTNPPYRRVSSGRINPDSQRAIARHEVFLSLPSLLAVVRSVLKTGGRFVMVYQAQRLSELFLEMAAAGLSPKTLISIHGRRDTGAKICLVVAVKGANPGLEIKEPLIVYEASGAYTDAVRRMLQA